MFIYNALIYHAKEANMNYFHNNFTSEEKEFIINELTFIYREIQNNSSRITKLERFYGHKSENIISFIKNHLVSNGYYISNGVSRQIFITWA